MRKFVSFTDDDKAILLIVVSVAIISIASKLAGWATQGAGVLGFGLSIIVVRVAYLMGYSRWPRLARSVLTILLLIASGSLLFAHTSWYQSAPEIIQVLGPVWLITGLAGFIQLVRSDPRLGV